MSSDEVPTPVWTGRREHSLVRLRLAIFISPFVILVSVWRTSEVISDENIQAIRGLGP